MYESEDFIDLIEGTIEEDGSFTVNFLGIEDIEDALKPLGNDSSDDYVGMYCRDAIIENMDSDNLFTDVSVFNLTYGEDNNSTWIGLTSKEPNNNIYPPQSDHTGNFLVRWIFSNQDVTIKEECLNPSEGTDYVDLELSEGWNEVVFDLSNGEDRKQYTGERPDEVDWAIDE